MAMDEEEKRQLYFALIILVVQLAIGTVFYHNVEHWRYIDSAYFSTTTLATVGFGDLHPVTDSGKIFTIFYVLIGVSIALYAFTIIAQHYFDRNIKRFDTAVDRLKRMEEATKRTRDSMKEDVLLQMKLDHSLAEKESNSDEKNKEVDDKAPVDKRW